MSDPYEVKPAPGAGMGVFATRALDPGDVIMHDTFAMRFRNGPDVSAQHVEHAFTELSSTDQKTFLSLHEGPYPSPSRLKRIFEANAFGHGDMVLLFFKIARVNHACTPNAQMTDLDLESDSKVVALERIGKGEQIFLNYIALVLEGTREDRKTHLHSNYGFVCKCRACSLTGKEGEVSDMRRKLFAGLAAKSAGKQPWSYKEHPRGAHPMGGKDRVVVEVVQPPLSKPLTSREKVHCAFFTAKLREAEGMKTREVSDAYVYAALALHEQINMIVRRGRVVVMPTAKLLKEWIDMAVALMKGIRKASHNDVRGVEQFAQTFLGKDGCVVMARLISPASAKVLKRAGSPIDPDTIFAVDWRQGPGKEYYLTQEEYLQVVRSESQCSVLGVPVKTVVDWLTTKRKKR
ncbi:SET domain-containing protein 5 [Saxophila tyrrhenica]|uniref:SET domain-containing protein 5 n=1 Tax=Saxophila tyrrhenica TaxID=1690608 RepID=A0AAV9PD65_9PEZI|nr:SET domain-containing protein 5 [Saxophila tyrrhenica]